MSWLAQNFDFTRGDTIVRLIAGIFLVPHIYSKLVGSGTVGFFKAAGFKPPAFWMYVACVIEASVAMSFLSNMYARYFGVLGAVHLLIAGAAVYRVNKGKWLWNFGGYEYGFLGGVLFGGGDRRLRCGIVDTKGDKRD
jgi:putative oxidoreductase